MAPKTEAVGVKEVAAVVAAAAITAAAAAAAREAEDALEATLTLENTLSNSFVSMPINVSGGGITSPLHKQSSGGELWDGESKRVDELWSLWG